MVMPAFCPDPAAKSIALLDKARGDRWRWSCPVGDDVSASADSFEFVHSTLMTAGGAPPAIDKSAAAL